MGGLLSGIDQSLISGANLYMPASLHLDQSQVSLVASEVPLGAIGGALLLGPINEAVGRRMAIIISLILYTIGAVLEAGAINFGKIVAGRVILGLGVGLEGGLCRGVRCTQIPRQPGLPIPIQYCTGRSFRLRCCGHFRQCQEWQLALHARFLFGVLHDHASRHVFHARKPTISYAQRRISRIV